MMLYERRSTSCHGYVNYVYTAFIERAVENWVHVVLFSLFLHGVSQLHWQEASVFHFWP